ncbi:styrene monooxygenase/indole monooxygenase family protein [Embleya sp. AB8]|uniref:styrene monooxygenase/indole monooxygenase family protein n=1 Tax=Embleya sp. AB8 TaxID=3156304 RepID=UPI003C727A36
MVRRIAIVGAGQAGLHLALGLQASGYQVTLVAARTPDEVRAGRVLSTQAMFGPARRIERDAGLNLWEDAAPLVDTMRFTLVDPAGTPALEFSAVLDDGQQSVDQRVKTAGWLELYEQRGGTVLYRTADRAEVARLADTHDLTVIATGRGDPAALFTPDPSRTRFDRPQRTLACVYLHGVDQGDHPGAVRVYAIAGGGELFLQPALTLSGPCTILLWEAHPGGPTDRFADRPDPDTMLRRSLDLIRHHVPWEYDLCARAEPTDPASTLYGAVTPVVRHPVAGTVPGRHVLGMADVTVLNDPVTGQGANNAARCAAVYLRAIRDRGDAPFDTVWMHDTHATFWEHACHSVDFTALMLAAPPADHVQQVLAAAAAHPRVADRFAYGYADPADLRDWLLDADLTRDYLTAVAAAP